MSKFRRITLPKDDNRLIPATPEPTPVAPIVEPSATLGSIVDPSRLTPQDGADLDAAVAAQEAAIAAINLPKLTTKFLLAGKALFTVTNPAGDHYTFKVRKVTSEYPKGSGRVATSYFVSVKAPGGIYPYRYIGLLNDTTGGIKCAGKSEFISGTKEYNVAAWACGVVVNMKALPAGYKIEHAGKCGRCGLTLTDPESIERGIGPDCWAAMEVK